MTVFNDINFVDSTTVTWSQAAVPLGGSVTATATSAEVKITTFLATGMWTIDPRTKIVEFYLWGGGAGGGSGRCGVAGSSGGGGGGSGGGGTYQKALAASVTGSPYTVTVGTGGAGGISVNAVTTNGNPGTAGNPSSVGALVTTASIATFGAAGGGTTTTASGGIAGSSTGNILGTLSVITGSGGQGRATSGLASAAATYLWSSGGGGGAGFVTATGEVGGAGQNIQDMATNILVAGGNAGTIAGGDGGQGNVPSAQLMTIGGTGGGGGGCDGVSVSGKGGKGAQPGGGGGGGAGALSSTPSGAGGDGGNGMVIIIEYF